ncbi:nucleotidyltransferase domain-containing protein [bacterium]|nr:nucleotidyltransferase domain-containing protein [bacterium]
MVTQEQIDEIKRRIVENFKPEKIILFGSCAEGNPKEDSDLDLLIVKNSKESPYQRIVAVRRLLSRFRRGLGLDVIVITQEELRKRLEIGDQFIEKISTEGKVLYAR